VSNYTCTGIFVAFLLCLLSSSIYASETNQDIKKLLEEDRYEEAISKMELLPRKDTISSARVLNALGWAYLKLGNYQKAKDNLQASYELAKKLDNQEVAVISSNNLGILAYLENDLEKAEKYFYIGKRKNSRTALTYLDLIEKKNRNIRFQEALLNGIDLRRKQDFKGAIGNYEKALSIQPNDAATLEYKGYALLRDGQHDLSVKTLDKAKTLDPTRKFVYLNLVKAYCMLQSDQDVQQSIIESSLEIDEFVQWYAADSEFRKMCSNSTYIYYSYMIFSLKKPV